MNLATFINRLGILYRNFDFYRDFRYSWPCGFAYRAIPGYRTTNRTGIHHLYWGANAQSVLNSVIAPLEEQINGAENMDYMYSSAANNGSATITVTFKPGMDTDMAAVDVQNRVAKAASFLPAEVNQVGVITQKRMSSMLIVFDIYDEANKYSESFIENYLAINVIPVIKRIYGVGDAMVMGADYSMRIWLKPDVMAQYGLMPTDISAALAEQNIEAAPGQFGESGKRASNMS